MLHIGHLIVERPSSDFHFTTCDLIRVILSQGTTIDWNMNKICYPMFRQSRLVCYAPSRPFKSAAHLQACQPDKAQRPEASGVRERGFQSKEPIPKASPQPLSTLRLPFWSCRSTWRRAGINTLRCLIGCTVGDFSALWILQTYQPELGMGNIMAISSGSSLERVNQLRALCTN